MTDEEVNRLLRNALREAMPDRASQIDEMDLDQEFGDLGISSVVAMEIIGYVEDALARTFKREELAGVHRLSDMATLIRRRAAESR
jgi:acyl carrier protein